MMCACCCLSPVTCVLLGASDMIAPMSFDGFNDELTRDVGLHDALILDQSSGLEVKGEVDTGQACSAESQYAQQVSDSGHSEDRAANTKGETEWEQPEAKIEPGLSVKVMKAGIAEVKYARPAGAAAAKDTRYG